MKSPTWYWSAIALSVLLTACADSSFNYPSGPVNSTAPSTPTPGGPPANWTITPNALVTAGLNEQQPTTIDDFNNQVSLAHLGVSGITRGYQFSTPTNTPFAFSVVARNDVNEGPVTLRVGHAQNAGTPPATTDSIGEAGMLLEATTLFRAGSWNVTAAEGNASVTVRGRIRFNQVLVFEATTSLGVELIAVRLVIGVSSQIRLWNTSLPVAGTISHSTIYSTDDAGFGLPAIAVSGDRYSVVAYQGGGANQRTRRWLQLDAQTGAVTGGEVVSVSPDSGVWRDQEIAALHNVLAVAYTGHNAVQIEISYDRGGSFATPAVLDEYASTGVSGQRLVQICIGENYDIAVAYWRAVGVGGSSTSQLCVVQGQPTGFDLNSTPTGYAFGAPWIAHEVPQFMVPLVMGLEYSSQGDLALSLGYNTFGGFSSTLWTYLIVREAGQAPQTILVDMETETWGNDPSVAIVGSGATLRIFVAYETSTGIRLAEYRKLGGSLITGSIAVTGTPGAYLPSVHARMQGGALKVDLLYLTPSTYGFSLTRTGWTDWDQMLIVPMHENLFTAAVQQSSSQSQSGQPGQRVTRAGWMGYDSVTNGDDVAIVLHTVSQEWFDRPKYYASPCAPGAPPTYSPGMTGTVPAPDPSHRNQLEVLVID